MFLLLPLLKKNVCLFSAHRLKVGFAGTARLCALLLAHCWLQGEQSYFCYTSEVAGGAEARLHHSLIFMSILAHMLYMLVVFLLHPEEERVGGICVFVFGRKGEEGVLIHLN